MHASDLETTLPLVDRHTPVLDAARMIAGERLPVLVIADDHGRPAAVISAVDVLSLLIPSYLRDDASRIVPASRAETSWGTPSLDLPGGVAAVLAACGVDEVHRLELCTMTDPRFYSHRRSSRRAEPTGRFAGVIRLAGVSPQS